MTGNNAVRRVDIAPHVPGRRRIALLLEAAGYPTLAGWARYRATLTGDPRFRPQTVNQVISGARRNATADMILDAIAEDTGKARRVIDQLVAGNQPADDSTDVGEVSHAAGKMAPVAIDD